MQYVTYTPMNGMIDVYSCAVAEPKLTTITEVIRCEYLDTQHLVQKMLATN